MTSATFDRISENYRIITHLDNEFTALISAVTQIGIMLLGTMVDNLVVGGPAYNSRQLYHGDVIVKVDGIPITASNIHEVMVGDDIPGAPVVVSVARGGPKVLPSPVRRPLASRA
jgi:C-terminal processing protease CtpA/Prc